MIRKNTKEPTINHYCGECALAVADYKFENLSLEGKPPKFRHCGFQSAQKEAQRLTATLGTTARILMEYDVEDILPF